MTTPAWMQTVLDDIAKLSQPAGSVAAARALAAPGSGNVAMALRSNPSAAFEMAEALTDDPRLAAEVALGVWGDRTLEALANTGNRVVLDPEVAAEAVANAILGDQQALASIAGDDRPGNLQDAARRRVDSAAKLLVDDSFAEPIVSEHSWEIFHGISGYSNAAVSREQYGEYLEAAMGQHALNVVGLPEPERVAPEARGVS